MAKLNEVYVLTLTEGGVLERREPENGNEGRIELREPTNKEWNEYETSRFKFSKKGRLQRDTQGIAREALFDATVQSIENVEDRNGPVTISDLVRIPARYKQRAVFLCYEDDGEIDDEKN